MLFRSLATTEIYTGIHTLSLHDALPISGGLVARGGAHRGRGGRVRLVAGPAVLAAPGRRDGDRQGEDKDHGTWVQKAPHAADDGTEHAPRRQTCARYP